MEDRIERRIAIRSAQATVWDLVARPGWWLPGGDAEPARRPGRTTVTCDGDTRPYVIDVIRVEPQGYISFRWASAFAGAAPEPGHATMVECYVRPAGGEIGVTVVESGFSALDLPESLREDGWKGNVGGWRYELAGLRTRAEQARLCGAVLAESRPVRRGASGAGYCQREAGGPDDDGGPGPGVTGRPGRVGPGRNTPIVTECRLFETGPEVGHWTRDTDKPRG